MWWSSKELIFFTISMMEECGGPERTDFFTVNTLGWCGGLERTDF